MNTDELFEKVKMLLNEGNLDKAKTFVTDHKDELGDYYGKAQNLLKEHSTDVGGLLDKAKMLFNKNK